MPQNTPRFKAGDQVCLTADPRRRGAVTGVINTATVSSYTVFFSAAEVPTFAENKLSPVVPDQPDNYRTHREFLRDLLLIKLRQPLTDSLYAYQASRTLFRVYQFKPTLKILDSPQQRILIADEVGLGKTIEAGTIYLEIKARFPLRRVLLVCPSGLRAKWHAELRSRFDEEFRILDAEEVRIFVANQAQAQRVTARTENQDCYNKSETRHAKDNLVRP